MLLFGVFEVGIEKMCVDFGIEKDCVCWFVLWSLLYMFGVVFDFDVVFKDVVDCDVVCDFMEMMEWVV